VLLSLNEASEQIVSGAKVVTTKRSQLKQNK
jgi:hypothetical protein